MRPLLLALLAVTGCDDPCGADLVRATIAYDPTAQAMLSAVRLRLFANGATGFVKQDQLHAHVAGELLDVIDVRVPPLDVETFHPFIELAAFDATDRVIDAASEDIPKSLCGSIAMHVDGVLTLQESWVVKPIGFGEHDGPCAADETDQSRPRCIVADFTHHADGTTTRTGLSWCDLAPPPCYRLAEDQACGPGGRLEVVRDVPPPANTSAQGTCR